MKLSERERRAQMLLPLFAYLKRHGVQALWLAREMGIQPPEYIYHYKRGTLITPPRFIERACKALKRSPEEVGFYVPQETTRRRKSA